MEHHSVWRKEAEEGNVHCMYNERKRDEATEETRRKEEVKVREEGKRKKRRKREKGKKEVK